MKKISLVSCLLALSAGAWAQSTPPNQPLRSGLSDAQLRDWKQRTQRVDGTLLQLADEYRAFVQAGARGAFVSANQLLPLAAERVAVDAVAADDGAALQAALAAHGMSQGAHYGRMVSGYLPLAAIDALASVAELHFVRPALRTTRVGSVTSQGDAATLSDDARADFGIDGSGVTVGTLSDSYDCLGGAAGDVASGDLPAGVNVLSDSCPGTDEGRGMMQLIADLAPGAAQAFHTAGPGQAGFASGIIDLANVANSDVIVDDIIYLAEPMFADGVVAQAVDTVTAGGAAYFSAAGNNARLAYESAFESSGLTPAPLNPGDGVAHDFDPGAGVDTFQQITVAGGATITVSFQWDQPYFSVSSAPGAANDIDIYLTDDPPTTLLAGSVVNNIGSDPIEVMQFTNPGATDTFNLLIVNFSGTDPGFMKHVGFGPFQIDEFDTASGTLYGHTNAASAQSVGAVAFFETPEFGQTPPLLESFSSGGRTPILFDIAGNSINISRQKPEISCVDGGNTTFFGSDSAQDPDTFPNFFGTSAAAPHAAAIAALMLDIDPSLTVSEINDAMEQTAIDIGPVGVDDDSGAGLCQAEPAVRSLIASVSVTPNPDTADTGQLVDFAAVVTNNTDISIDLTALTDDLFGDVNGQGDCVTPQTIAAGGNYSCTYSATATGTVGGTQINTVTAAGTAGPGGTFSANDSASVALIDANPNITVSSSADPDNVDEPGASVDFTVRVDNLSVEPLELTVLNDDVSGDLDMQGDCAVPQTIAAGDFYQCTYSATVTGNGGDSQTNTTSATAGDDERNEDSSSGASTVTVNDVTPSITVGTSALPSEVDEPGDNVDFTVRVDNTSIEAIELTGLIDDVHGDLDTQGDCAVPQSIGIGAFYECSFTALVSGNAGDSQTNTVTATANDDESNVVMETASSTVTLDDVAPSISVSKSALPATIDEPGDDVTFTARVDNTSIEPVELTALVDDIHGNLNGQGGCAVPQTIGSGGFYQCTFTIRINGNAGDTETDIVTATATDDEANVAMAMDSATVTVADVLPAISVSNTATPTTIGAPGATVGFAVQVTNSGVEPVELTALNDDVHGDLNTQGDCLVPQTIAAGGSYQCAFTAMVNGNAGDSQTNTVTATANDDELNAVMATDSATVDVTDAQFDLGDAPTPYPTLLADDGARHELGSAIFLGAQVDSEADGQPDASASGDDLADLDDEDGVSFGGLVAGSAATVDVTASAQCLLNAWVDFNADDDWADAGEQVFTDEGLAAGGNSLVFTVPVTSAVGDTFARLRCSSAGGVSFDGAAGDGEVEDYIVTIAADDTPPSVLNVDSVPDSGDANVAGCEELRAAPAELLLAFSEAMTDPAGDTDPGDVTNPAQYRLLASGNDQDFQSDVCGAVQGDDRDVLISAASYDAVTDEATLAVVGIGGNTELFRLETCGTTPVADIAGNPLDGDGDGSGGDSFVLGFRIETGNELVNGQFDCDLASWSPVSTDPGEVVHDNEDVTASSISGSLLITNLTASSDFSASQCVPLQPGAEYAWVYRYRVDQAAGAPLNVVDACEFFDAADCGGASLGSASDLFSTGDTGAQFASRRLPLFAVPSGAVSGRCELDIESPEAGTFEIRFDHVVLDRVRFRDSFEGP